MSIKSVGCNAYWSRTATNAKGAGKWYWHRGRHFEDVADLHNVTVAELRSRRRFRELVAARHAAIWVLRQVYPTMSEQRIAEAVGLTDHTTVCYALAKLGKIVERNDAYAANLWDIVNAFKGIHAFVAKLDSQPKPLVASLRTADWWAVWSNAQRGTSYVEAA